MAEDSYTPDVGMRVDGRGRVTYDFTGHVSAAGVDLLAGTSAAVVPPSDRKVNWLDGPGGAVVADVSATREAGSSRAVLGAHKLANSDESTALLASYRADGAERGRLELIDFGVGPGTQLSARVFFPGTTSRMCTIITDTGASDFLLADGVIPTRGPSGIVVGQTNNAALNTTCPFTINGPLGVPRHILVRASMTGHVPVAGSYFHGFQIPGVGTATRDFYYNLTGVHLTAGVISDTFLSVPPGNYAVSPFHNVTVDANDRWECSVLLTGD